MAPNGQYGAAYGAGAAPCDTWQTEGDGALPLGPCWTYMQAISLLRPILAHRLQEKWRYARLSVREMGCCGTSLLCCPLHDCDPNPQGFHAWRMGKAENNVATWRKVSGLSIGCGERPLGGRTGGHLGGRMEQASDSPWVSGMPWPTLERVG